MPDSTLPPKPKRRWLRYSLRSFFVLLTIGCSLLGYWVYRAERQRAAVTWVEENGGIVFYDFQLAAMRDALRSGALNKQEGVLRHQERMRRSFVDDYLSTVTSVMFRDSEVKDLTALAHLDQLEDLSFLNTPVSDITPLAGMTSLRSLSLVGTEVTQEQIDDLQKTLPDCGIVWIPRKNQ